MELRTLFKNIRQQLIPGSLASKYLLYAIGEFVLIVAGILFALQINNWNQERALQAELRSSLEKLKSDLANDYIVFNRQDSVIQEFIQSAEKIQSLLIGQTTLDDLTAIRKISITPYNLDYYSDTYHALTNTGLFYKIKNETLTKMMSDYYRELVDMEEITFRQNEEMSRLRTNEILVPFEYMLKTDENLIPDDPTALIWMNDSSSQVYQAVQEYLASYLRAMKYRIRRMEEFSEMNRNLFQTIEIS